MTLLPGLVLSFIIALIAWQIGNLFPIIGSPVFGMLIGILMAFGKRPKILEKGIAYTTKKILKIAIILLGFNLNLNYIWTVGKETLILMIFTLSATFITAYMVGKFLKIEKNTNILIGVGTAICGGSAIAATAPIIDAADDEVAHSISTIFLFNIIGALIFPVLGHFFNMSDHFFGIWAGTAINDTSSVVAAGYSFSDSAGDLAVIVKLTRTLMIIPVTLVLALYKFRKDQNTYNHLNELSGISLFRQLTKAFPVFVLGFLMTSLFNTFLGDYISYWPSISKVFTFMGKFLIVMAMSAIGLNTHFHKLIKNGMKPILLGFATWIVLALVSISVQIVL